MKKISLSAVNITTYLIVFFLAISPAHSVEQDKESGSNTLVLPAIFPLLLGNKEADPYAGWTHIRNQVDDVVLTYNPIQDITNVYVTDTATKDIYHTINGTDWTKVGGPGYQFVAGRQFIGTTLYGLSTDQSAVYQYQWAAQWRKVGGAAKRLYGGAGGLYAVSPANDNLYSYDVINDTWAVTGGPGKMFAVGGLGELYAVSLNDSVYRQIQPAQWEQIGGYTKTLYAAPGYLYSIGQTGDIFQYNGLPYFWTKIGGPGKMFAASEEGDLYRISPDGEGIYRYLGVPDEWEKIGGESEKIFAQGDNLYSLLEDGSLWAYKRPTLATDADLLIIVQKPSLSHALEEYVAYKQQQGHSVAVVSLDIILRVANGIDEAEKIRNFLIYAYQGGRLHYAMLVGDINTIPTKILFDSNGVVEGNRATQNAYSTDFYYANLHTLDWDLDDDDLWGERVDDNLSIVHDIVVSRIPFNDSDTLQHVMRNFIDFDKKNGEQWQRKVILAYGFLSENDDLASFAEAVDQEILQPYNFTAEKLYVNKEKTTSVHFDPGTVTPLENSTYMASLTPDGQGLALLAAHGGPNSMSSMYITNEDKVDWIHFGIQESVRNHSLSGIYHLNGCSTAPTVWDYDGIQEDQDREGSLWSSLGRLPWPNITKDYLTSGAVAVIASTVGSDSGSQVLEYELAKGLISEGLSVGDAFVKAKETAGDSRAMQTFYLVGDPTIKLR